MLLALPYPTMNFLPFYAAEDLGFFSRAGVEVHCLHVRETKQKKVQFCLEGDLHFYTSVSTTTEAGIRYQSEVLALAKGVSKQVTLSEVADLSFLQRAKAECGIMVH